MRLRAWRITMWTSLAATVLLAGGAVGTRERHCVWRVGRSLGVGLSCGNAVVGGGVPRTDPEWFRNAYATQAPLVWWMYVDWGSTWILSFSLWLPAAATFAIAGPSAFMVRRTRHRPGRCPTCGYDRSGLSTDAPCPECGRNEEDKASVRRPDPARA